MRDQGTSVLDVESDLRSANTWLAIFPAADSRALNVLGRLPSGWQMVIPGAGMALWLWLLVDTMTR
jgi:hypothetical protein